MRADDIVGYTYQADNYCPEHIMAAVVHGPSYEGWELAQGAWMTTEANLNEIAFAFGIDRTDESTYDSSDFPKVIYADQAEDSSCDSCPGGLTLIGGDVWHALSELLDD